MKVNIRTRENFKSRHGPCFLLDIGPPQGKKNEERKRKKIDLLST